MSDPALGLLMLGLIVVALDRSLSALGKGDSSLTPT